MAVPLRGERGTVNWEKVVGTKPEDNIHDAYLAFEMFAKGDAFVGVDGGDYLAAPVEYGLNQTAGSHSDLDEINIERQDVFDRAEIEWSEQVVAVTVSDLQKNRNKGSAAVFELLPALFENARKTSQRSVNSQLFSTGLGNGGKDIKGFQTAISSTPTTGTYAGINRGTFSFFRNQQTSGAQSVSAFDNLRAAWRSIHNLASNGMKDDHPKNIITDRTGFQGYESLLLPEARYKTSDSKTDGGFRNETLMFKDSNVGWDGMCPAGNAYFFGSHIKFYYVTGQWMKMGPPVRPANQTAETRIIYSMCQLLNLQPRRSGVVTGQT